jgi:hypothetical protein
VLGRLYLIGKERLRDHLQRDLRALVATPGVVGDLVRRNGARPGAQAQVGEDSGRMLVKET